MTPPPRAIALLAALLLSGCGDRGAPESGTERPPGATARYTREIAFLGWSDGRPIAATVVSRVEDGPRDRGRSVRAWLARGQVWDRFLENGWRSSRTGSPWTLVPRGGFSLAVHVGGQVESLWYRNRERSLRLELGAPLAGWARGGRGRLHLFRGGLVVGGERTEGTVMELLRVEPAAGETGADLDQLLLVGPAGERFLLAAGADARRAGAPLGWWRGSDGEGREVGQVELRATGVQPLAPARREIPRSWSFQAGGGTVRGEVRAMGLAAEVGEEREGRRAIVVRYTVSGWLAAEGRRIPVVGILRHRQG